MALSRHCLTWQQEPSMVQTVRPTIADIVCFFWFDWCVAEDDWFLCACTFSSHSVWWLCLCLCTAPHVGAAYVLHIWFHHYVAVNNYRSDTHVDATSFPPDKKKQSERLHVDIKWTLLFEWFATSSGKNQSTSAINILHAHTEKNNLQNCAAVHHVWRYNIGSALQNLTVHVTSNQQQQTDSPGSLVMADQVRNMV